ncbi:hypothetical protein L7F22_025670 [Adiantum nelumboides]|nr:hypothetical protein [Adiantum nelumboides]
MMLQSIVDSNMRFIDVNVGWLGSCNDKRVLQNSGIYRLCQGGDHLKGVAFSFQNISIPEYIVGDGGYVLLPWLMISFQRAQLISQRHCNYNFMQSSTRIVVERSFARLKCTWQILKGTICSQDIRKLPNVILACCILHNMVVTLSDEQVDLEDHHIDLNDPLIDNPHRNEGRIEGESAIEAISMRDALLDYLDMQGINN